jgi:hypothetical protein
MAIIWGDKFIATSIRAPSTPYIDRNCIQEYMPTHKNPPNIWREASVVQSHIQETVHATIRHGKKERRGSLDDWLILDFDVDMPLAHASTTFPRDAYSQPQSRVTRHHPRIEQGLCRLCRCPSTTFNNAPPRSYCGPLTPALCTSFATTPCCGDRIIVSIFILSILHKF